MFPACGSCGDDEFIISHIRDHNGALLLIRAVPALDLAVTSVYHVNTVAVLAGELTVVTGTHRHVPGQGLYSSSHLIIMMICFDCDSIHVKAL